MKKRLTEGLKKNLHGHTQIFVFLILMLIGLHPPSGVGLDEGSSQQVEVDMPRQTPSLKQYCPLQGRLTSPGNWEMSALGVAELQLC